MVVLWGAERKSSAGALQPTQQCRMPELLRRNSREMKVPYTLKGDGTTILVPAAMVLRRALTSRHLERTPQGGGVGYEVFGNRPLGA